MPWAITRDPRFVSDDNRLPQGAFSIDAMADYPGKEGYLYVGLSLSPDSPSVAGGSYLYLTKDGGRTWSSLGSLGQEQICAILLLPQPAPSLLVVTNRGVHQWSQNRWTLNPAPEEGLLQAAVGYQPATGRAIIYAGHQIPVRGQQTRGRSLRL